MVPCPSSKTLGPATNNFRHDHEAQITSVSTFTQECPAKLARLLLLLQVCRQFLAQFRGISRPIAALSSFAWAEAVPGLRSHGPLY